MSNYPPGVTGDEYAIAGGTETEEYWECENMVSGITITMNLLQEMADDAKNVNNPNASAYFGGRRRRTQKRRRR